MAVTTFSSSNAPILIAGAGIGGLACAIALARQGLPVRLLERSAAPQEASAGIQLGPNGVAILEELGAAVRLAPLAVAPEAVRIFDASSGRPLNVLPLGNWIAARHGAPYWTVRRSDLHAALLATARELPSLTFTAPFEVREIVNGSDGVQAVSAGGERVAGRALIGADGLWSRVRTHVAPGHVPRRSACTALRALTGAEAAPSFFRERAVGLWFAPFAHIVHYPVEGGQTLAAVVVIEDRRIAEAWDAAADRSELLRFTARLAPPLVEFLSAVPAWRKWTLFDAAPLYPWVNGRVALLGDAAHPLLPFFAQGGVLALEDALVLAANISRSGERIEQALAAYEHARRPRAARVEAASRRNGWIYHVSGALGAARNAYLRAMPPQRLMAGYDWLYGWRFKAPGDSPKTVEVSGKA